MSTIGSEHNADYFRRLNEYWRRVDESDGFDIEGIRGPQGMAGLLPFNCQGLNFHGYPYGPLVHLYARVGLHRYNMKEGTNFELHALIKFNMLSNLASSYFITLAARDTVTRRPMQTFQVRVDEKQCGLLDMTCSIARIKGETTSEPLIPQYDSGVNDGLPDWPSDDDAFNDIQRFYLVEGSELLDTYWIPMYLQLAVYTNDRSISDRDLSKLKIVKVAIETSNEDVEPPNERLNAKSAIFYIAFKGLATGGIGEHVERKAIIKRVVNERTGNLSLEGVLCRGEEELNVMSWEEIHKQHVQSLRAV